MKAIYLISGLGADERVFQFLDLSGYQLHYIRWIRPLANESISAYATRLLAQINTPTPIIIAVSFGGLIANEIGRQISVEKIIIISSIRTRHDIPVLYRLIGKLRLHKLIPTRFFTKTNRLLFWLFGIRSPAERQLLIDIIQDSDPFFTAWAINQILSWKNSEAPPNLIAVHGTSDRLLPARPSGFLITHGGHFMVVNRAAEISKLLKEIL